MTITEFLAARYDEDEAQARSAIDNRMRANIHPSDKGPQTYGPVDISDDSELGDMAIGAEYVLADIAAKRAIVVEHTCQCPDPDCGDCGACSGDHHADPTPAPCTTLRLLAQPYAEHPDFDESWKP